MNSKEIREAFLSYFEGKRHTRVGSSSLLLNDDPTLLFPNAGMNQFKSCFLGTEKRDYVRATTSQKCMRISGKHNDFENVGVTPRHHTFFEMLGNFSFGDYFKKEAIGFAWEFIVDVMKVDPERLWVTIFNDDDEAAELWQSETPVKAERIVRLGEKDNFWAMGDTGPCGPCSEIHYCVLDDPSKATAKGLEDDDGSFLEIWNLVFMQFNRLESGETEPLPKPSVDTGMGLERITAVKNNLGSNYDTDLLRGVISVCEELSGFTYDGSSFEVKSLKDDLPYARDVAMRVIADHSRAIAFLIADGIHPASDGRGYVLRRILRRAVRHGRVLNFKEPFLKSTTGKIVELLGDVYPELKEAKTTIENVAEAEEIRFYETLDGGLALLQKEVESLGKKKVFPGKTAFQLYDTYGFPIDLTEDALKAYGMTVDKAEYDKELEAQRTRSRAERATKKIAFSSIDYSGNATEFLGYGELTAESKLVALQGENKEQDTFKAGQQLQFITDATPFYGESGGQVGDRGTASLSGGSIQVLDTQKTPSGHFVHYGEVTEGEISKKQVGEKLSLNVDKSIREATTLNHSATHLVHSALREVLGDHVKQAGSRVDENTLRFDFSHFETITSEQLTEITHLVNDQVRANHQTQIEEMSLDAAKAKGAIALFGEKYGDTVRVVEIGPKSLELCGGTHVGRSGDIGFVSILSEGGISSGVRRIECLAGTNFERAYQNEKTMLSQIAGLLKSDKQNLPEKVEKILERQKELEQELQKVKSQLAQSSTGDFMGKVKTSPSGVSYIAESVTDMDTNDLKTLVDKLRVELGSGVVALGASVGEKGMLVAGVTKDLAGKVHAGNLVKEAVKESGGKGGGRPDFAQAGGVPLDQLNKTLETFSKLIE